MTGGELLPHKAAQKSNWKRMQRPLLGRDNCFWPGAELKTQKGQTGFGVSLCSLNRLPPIFPLKVIYSPFSQVLQSPQSSDFFLKRQAHTELCRNTQLPTDHLAEALFSKTHLNSRHLVISFCRCITSYNRFWSCR